MWLDTVVLVQHKTRVRGYWGPGSIVGQGEECDSGAHDHRFAAGSFVAVYRAPGWRDMMGGKQ